MTPSAVRDPSSDDAYGYGIVASADGTVLSHSGGMVRRYVNIVVDLASGIAVGAMVNGYGAPGRRAATPWRCSTPLPPASRSPTTRRSTIRGSSTTPRRSPGASRGRRELEVVAGDGTLALRVEWPSRIPLARSTPSSFVVLDDPLGVALLECRVEEGRVVEVDHGVRRYLPAGDRPEADQPLAHRLRNSRSKVCTVTRTHGCPCSASPGAGAASSSSTRRRAGAERSRATGARARPAPSTGRARSTLRAVLPRISRARPVWPRVPITIGRAPFVAAKRTISVAGSPSSASAVACSAGSGQPLRLAPPRRGPSRCAPHGARV